MDDAQHPTDGDGESGQQLRRAGLRLRDAEAVATTRRDMFGDGPLLDTLAAALPARADAQDEPPSQEPASLEPHQDSTLQEPVQQPPYDEAGAVEPADVAGGTPAPAETADDEAGVPGDPAAEPRFTAIPASFPFAQVPQSLDSIIDSFATAPASQEPERPQPAGNGFLPPQLESPGPGAEADDAPPERTSAAPPAQMAVSSFFDSLTEESPRAEASEPVEPVEEYPPPEVAGLDMSMLGRPLPHAMPRRRSDAEPPPASDEDERQDIGDTGPPLEAATGGEVEATLDGGAERAVETASHVLDMPPLADDFESQPFPEPAARPFDRPFYSEPPDAPSDAEYPAPPAMPPFPDSWAAPGMPPFSEATARPSFLEPLVRRPQLPAYPEEPDPLAAPPFPEPIVSETSAPEPIVSASEPRSPEPETAAQPMFDAAAKIAAESNATAEALDNLRRLLDRDGPGQEADRDAPDLEAPVYRPVRNAAPLNLVGNPPQFAMNERAQLMPLPVPPDEGRGKGIYVLGFLTGLALSLMAGVALYLLITMG